MEIQLLKKERVHEVISLVERVADQYLDLTDEGKQSFQQVNTESFYQNCQILTYVAYIDQQIVGMICFHVQTCHIHLLFVDEKYFHQGIATKLMQVVDKLTVDDIHVHASDYALPFYQKQGFEIIASRQMKDGIAYTPMVKKKHLQKRFTYYEEVYDFINSQKDRVYSLDNFQRFMNDMNNPQLALPCVHIGGTNGKGSTTNYIKEVLKKAGYRVGTFTSPALEKRLDVMRINDIHIDEQAIVDMANRYVDIWLEYEISLFEIEVFIAIMYFLRQGIDIALFEVGLGGNLDATNIIMPLVALNTNIGLDHMDFLGDSYESIAMAKAGIIKDGIAFITGEHKQECLDIFRDECEKHHSELIRVGRIHDIQDGENVKYSYRDYNIVLNTPALYQIQNSALAIEALLYLRKQFNFRDEDLIYGLFEASWPGRFEKLRDKPLIIIDGAHNREGVDELYHSAKKFSHLKIIFSALRDKDTDYMIERLLELTYDMTVCEFDHPRAQKAKLLAKDYPVKVEPDYYQAIDDAWDYEGTLLITGSLYFITKKRPYIQQKLKDDENKAHI